MEPRDKIDASATTPDLFLYTVRDAHGRVIWAGYARHGAEAARQCSEFYPVTKPAYPWRVEEGVK
jgi:hypothetical protein